MLKLWRKSVICSNAKNNKMKRNSGEDLMGKSKTRSFFVFLAMLIVGGLCIVMLFHLSISEGAISLGKGPECLDLTDPANEGAEMNDSLYKCYVKANDLRPVRGEIYDDRGRLLVGNVTVFEVAFDGINFV